MADKMGAAYEATNMDNSPPSVDTFFYNYNKDFTGTDASNYITEEGGTTADQHLIASSSPYEVELDHPDLNPYTGNRNSPDIRLASGAAWTPVIEYTDDGGTTWVAVTVVYDADEITNKGAVEEKLQFVLANPKASTPTYFPKVVGNSTWAGIWVKVSYWTSGDDIWNSDINKIQNALVATEELIADHVNSPLASGHTLSDGEIPWSAINFDNFIFASGQLAYASGYFTNLNVTNHADFGGGYGDTGVTIDSSGNIWADGDITADDAVFDQLTANDITVNNTLTADTIVVGTLTQLNLASISGAITVFDASFQAAPSGNVVNTDVTAGGVIDASGYGLQGYYNEVYGLPDHSYDEPGDFAAGASDSNIALTQNSLTIKRGFMPIFGNRALSEVYKIWYNNPVGGSTWNEDAEGSFSFASSPQVFIQEGATIFEAYNFLLNTHIGRGILKYLGPITADAGQGATTPVISDWTAWDTAGDSVTTASGSQSVRGYLDRIAAFVANGRVQIQVRTSTGGAVTEFWDGNFKWVNAWSNVVWSAALRLFLGSTSSTYRVYVRAVVGGVVKAWRMYEITAGYNDSTGKGLNLISREDFDTYSICGGAAGTSGAWGTRVTTRNNKWPSQYTIGSITEHQSIYLAHYAYGGYPGLGFGAAGTTYDCHKIPTHTVKRWRRTAETSCDVTAFAGRNSFSAVVREKNERNVLDDMRFEYGPVGVDTAYQVARVMGFKWHSFDWMAIGAV